MSFKTAHYMPVHAMHGSRRYDISIRVSNQLLRLAYRKEFIDSVLEMKRAHQ
jgi:hypothetical protein